MKVLAFVGVAGVVVVLRIVLGRVRFRRRQSAHIHVGIGSRFGDIGMVAAREVRERVRSRVFRLGTVIIFLAVAAAIVIPVLGQGPEPPQSVGEVGMFTTSLRDAVVSTARSMGARVRLVHEQNDSAAHRDLVLGRISIAIIGGRRLVVNKPIDSSDTSTTARLVRALSEVLGLEEADKAAGLTDAQAAVLAHSKALPVETLQPPTQGSASATSVVGVILIFVMLTQYNTWILSGVLEEKSSRVVVVLLAAVRPLELLAGKVLGIGVVALAQASAIVAFALVLAKAVGSNVVHGTAPIELLSALVWLVLGYAFYCWVFAAAASTVQRQDQVQALALPLTLPILLGYVMALTVAGGGNPSLFFKVLAYIPLTAPMAMPVLVGLGQVQWWEFAGSVLISLIGTFGVARLAAGVYRRAILQSGRRVSLHSMLSRSQH